MFFIFQKMSFTTMLCSVCVKSLKCHRQTDRQTDTPSGTNMGSWVSPVHVISLPVTSLLTSSTASSP